MGLKRMSGGQPKMSKVRDNWYQYSIIGTQRHHSTYLPLTFPPSCSAQYTTSPTPWTLYHQDGPQVIMHQDDVPLKGGLMSGSIPRNAPSQPTALHPSRTELILCHQTIRPADQQSFQLDSDSEMSTQAAV